MRLQEYNKIQVKLFKELHVVGLSKTDLNIFIKICQLVSVIRSCNDLQKAEKVARQVIEHELENYKNKKMAA